jgi:hypothetical protein
MKNVNMQTTVEASPEDVWKVIGGFNTLPDWHPLVQKSELERGGVMRRLSLFGGGSIVERLEHFSNNDRVYTYSIIDAPLPVRNYVASIRVRDAGGGKGSIIEWSSEFEIATGATETDAVKSIEGIYQSGFDNLKKLFGGAFS